MFTSIQPLTIDIFYIIINSYVVIDYQIAVEDERVGPKLYLKKEKSKSIHKSINSCLMNCDDALI